ncbi:hypothetical protein ETD83_10165 [Actinomadura soli]|uniref:Uncharacterized protein n=1 Tax=Actinomadura soli TaxID=2508997 RepID=A0A5C4JHI6_9ACTN|nr:hypothetical protein [Actinomadura soli]TMR03684.1 hypothetical protein ETD83_10165 [Actinomadura soli]
MEPQEAAQAPETPGTEARDDTEPSPETAEERPDEIPDGTGEDRGTNSEDEPESPESEENDPDRFAGLPTRAALDPAGAGELTRERGAPLTPINENQDLSEPEDAEKLRHILRRNRENPDDAEKNLNNLTSNMDELLERPPSGNPISTQDTSNRGGQLHGDQQPGVQGGSVFYATVAIAMVTWKLHEKLSGRIRERVGRDDDSDR